MRSEYSNIHKMLEDLEQNKFVDIEKSDKKNFDCTKTMNLLIGQLHPSPHDEDEDMWWQDLYRGVQFFDDVNEGQALDWALVVQARRLEIEYFKKMGVYTK